LYGGESPTGKERSAVSYVSLNPVRARLVSRAEEWARVARRAPGLKAVAIPVGEQLNLLQ
jgi:hypothetical protein